MTTKKRKLPKTWEEFCKLTDRDPKALPDVSAYDDDQKKNAIANFKLPLIIKYCNGEKLDYSDKNQIKYEPWWAVVKDKSSGSGLGLSSHGCDSWGTITRCGPRFAFATVEVLKHVVKHFIKEYNDLYL